MQRLRWFDSELMVYSHEPPLRVRKRAIKFAKILFEFANKRLLQDELDLLERGFKRAIKDKVARDVAVTEIRTLAGNVYTAVDLARFAACLAGGYRLACQGVACGVGSAYWKKQDCLMRFTGVYHSKEQSLQKSEVRLDMVACNTRYAGTTTTVSVDLKKLRSWASMMGVRDFRKGLWLKRPKLMIGVECIGRVELDEGRLILHGITCDDTRKKANRRLLVRRFRKYHPCPKEAKHDCFKCRVGTNQCDLSCNPKATNFVFQCDQQK